MAGLPSDIASEVPTWFDEAVESVRESTEGKISCPLIKGDFDKMWDLVYWGEGQHESADAAIREHLAELDKSYKVTIAYDAAAIEAVRLARGRYEALLVPAPNDSEPMHEEKRKRAACMIISTELNIELTAICWAELVRHKGKRVRVPYGGISDIAHGFGPAPITTDSSSIYRRYAEAMEGKSDVTWTHGVWRMALETAAYPNISDTFDAMAQASADAQKQMLCPPDGTASNVEVRLMQVGYWAAMVAAACDKESRKAVDNGFAIDAYTWLARIGEQPIPRIIFDAVERHAPPVESSTFHGQEKAWENRRVEHRGYIRQWCCQWRESGYARIDVSHKLAAALMLTDVGPDIQVRGPWLAFSVHVPPGITRVSRILVWSGENSEGEHHISQVSVIFEDGSFGEFNENHLTAHEVDLLTNFVRGVCLAAEQGHAERAGNHGASGSKKGSKRFAKGPGAGERYQLAAPVKIDLRDAVREHLAGKRGGGAPTVQFIVRGHWRNQVHGPGRQHRKRIWIEPFWKGPEDSRVLLRGHQVEGDKLKEAP